MGCQSEGYSKVNLGKVEAYKSQHTEKKNCRDILKFQNKKMTLKISQKKKNKIDAQ